MDERVIQLEMLRQQVQAVGAAEGALCDYLDRGHPDAEQTLAAFDEMVQIRGEIKQLRGQLSEAMAQLRTTAQFIVVEWVSWHVGICQRILAEDAGAVVEGTVTDQQVRLFVAKETLEAWQKVLVGAQDYVMINDYYLADYAREVTAYIESLR